MESSVYKLISQSYAGAYGDLPFSKFLNARGERMMSEPRPRNIHKGAPRECFRNAWELSLTHDMEYWEGHAWDPALGRIPIHHAWCRTSSSRKVIDPTWHNGADALYFGVHVPRNVLLQSLDETKTFGVFDNSSVFRSTIAERYFMPNVTESDDRCFRLR